MSQLKPDTDPDPYRERSLQDRGLLEFHKQLEQGIEKIDTERANQYGLIPARCPDRPRDPRAKEETFAQLESIVQHIPEDCHLGIYVGRRGNSYISEIVELKHHTPHSLWLVYDEANPKQRFDLLVIAPWYAEVADSVTETARDVLTEDGLVIVCEGKDCLVRTVSEFEKLDAEQFAGSTLEEKYGLTTLSCIENVRGQEKQRDWEEKFLTDLERNTKPAE